MLILAATPIGNLQDASPRLKTTLANAALIAAEDTRKTRQLIQLLEINTAAKIVPLHDHNEQAQAEKLAQFAKESDVVLVSDAGMPTVADPGFRVVRAAITHNVQVTVIPGPSAALSALAISGLPTDRFSFEGFLPKKPSQLTKTLTELKNDPRTLIFFESAQRVSATLAHMATIFGADRQAAICRELTKMYEQVLRGSLTQLAATVTSNPVKGELVLVVAGAAQKLSDPQDALAKILQQQAAGVRLKDAVKAEAASSGIAARELYALALAAQKA